jgi:hypothetical protein
LPPDDFEAVGVLDSELALVPLDEGDVLGVVDPFGVVDALGVPGVAVVFDDRPGSGGAADNTTVSELPTFTSLCPVPETVVAIVSELFVAVTGLAEPNCVPMTLNRSVARLLRSLPAIVNQCDLAS